MKRKGKEAGRYVVRNLETERELVRHRVLVRRQDEDEAEGGAKGSDGGVKGSIVKGSDGGVKGSVVKGSDGGVKGSVKGSGRE